MGMAARRRTLARLKAVVQKVVLMMSMARERSWVEVALARARVAVLESMAAEILSGEGWEKVTLLVGVGLEGMGLWA